MFFFFFSHLTGLDYKVSYGEGSAEDDAKWTIPFSPRQGILSAQEPDQHPMINAVCPTHTLFGGWVSKEKDLWCPNWTEDVHEHTPGTDMAKAGLKMLGESIPVTLLGTCQILSEAGFYDFFSPSLKWNVSYVTGVNATKFECWVQLCLGRNFT